MIILDANVISEPLRTTPHAGVVAWLDAQVVETLYLTAVTLAELRYAIAALPVGKRRQLLNDRFEGDFLPLFAGRVLVLDEAATTAYASLRATARSQGSAIGDFDALIASIARATGYTVATRDPAPFDAVGVAVLDPFSLSAAAIVLPD